MTQRSETTPAHIFINEYDWGMGSKHYEDFEEARKEGVRRISENDENYIKTHIYQWVQS